MVQTVAIVLTALFTLLAAWAAMCSAKTSERQLKESLNRADQMNFFGLLDALEKAHHIRFLSRGVLYEKLKDFNEYIRLYELYAKSTNKSINSVISIDNNIKTQVNFVGNKGCSPKLFEAYLDYAKNISLLFEFDFVPSNTHDYVTVSPIGIVIPIYPLDPDKVVYVVDTIANEILGYKDTETYGKGIGVQRERNFESFEAFKSDCKGQNNSQYKYYEG